MAQKQRPQAETLSGSPQPNFTGYATAPVLAKRAPTTTDTGYPLGQIWIDKVGDDAYILVDVSAGVATWQISAVTPGEVSTLTGDSGGAISPSAGNINIAGTSGQIATAGSGSTIAISVPSTFSFGSNSGANSATILTGSGGLTVNLANGPCVIGGGTGQFDISSDVTNNLINIGYGSGSCVKTVNIGCPQSTSATLIQAGSGGITLNAASGTTSCTTDLALSSHATKVTVKGGSATDFIGSATLSNGVATIANTNIAATDRIMVTRSAKNGSTAYGTFQVVKTAATNFVITSCKSDTTTETGDQSTVDYIIFRQT